MKCNHCNTEVADGTNFCPNCGNKIETPQSLKCPQCNTEVSDGIKFCPNCGSPIGSPQPKKCTKCGTELEDGEKFCSNCGTPVNSSSIPQSSMAFNKEMMGTTIKLCWDGERRRPLWNNPISVFNNNQKCGEFFPKETFEKTINNVNSQFEVELKYGYNKSNINLSLEHDNNYLLVFYMNVISNFGYELKDKDGRLVKEDGNIGWLQLLLFFIIPLAGFIYFFIKKDFQPISAKAGLMLGFVNLGVTILNFLF